MEAQGNIVRAMTDDISTETRVAAFIERFDSLVREVGGCAKAA